jgi:hypothetical protein
LQNTAEINYGAENINVRKGNRKKATQRNSKGFGDIDLEDAWGQE